VAECIAEAARVARLMVPDRRWSGFPPSPDSYRSVSGIHDSAVASMGVDTLGMMADEMIEGAMSVSRKVAVPYGAVEAIERSVGVANSSGVDVVMKETQLGAVVCCVAGIGETISPDCEESGMSRGCDLRADKIGERAGWVADRSTRLLDAATEECEVVFSPMSLGSSDSGLLTVVLNRAFSGQSVMQRTSFLMDKEGEQIWSDRVSMSDNPLLLGKCGSRPFDDEGLPTTKSQMVRKGVLSGFLWDSHYGSLSGKGSTGNAVRDLSSGSLGVAPLCLQLSPGRGDMHSLIGEVEHGYLVWSGQGTHTSNPETGEFSFVASPGLLIEKGEVVGGVRGAMISGNISALMRNVELVGADVVDFGNSLMPSVLFRDVRVTTG
jgi:PmbA protein